MNIIINADIVAIVGAVIAFGSMIVSIISAIISGRNLKLEHNIYNETRPNFEMNEVLDSYVVYDDSHNIVKFLFYPLIINMSSKSMVIAKIYLELIGEDKTILLRPIIDERYINEGYSISANSADTKWVCFEINQETYKNLKMLRHNLTIEDAYQNKQTISMSWIKEVVTENEKANESMV